MVCRNSRISRRGGAQQSYPGTEADFRGNRPADKFGFKLTGPSLATEMHRAVFFHDVERRWGGCLVNLQVPSVVSALSLAFSQGRGKLQAQFIHEVRSKDADSKPEELKLLLSRRRR